MPAFVVPAFKAVHAENMTGVGEYAMIWNILHYPAGVVPVTEVKEGEDQVYEDGFNDMVTKMIR